MANANRPHPQSQDASDAQQDRSSGRGLHGERMNEEMRGDAVGLDGGSSAREAFDDPSRQEMRDGGSPDDGMRGASADGGGEMRDRGAVTATDGEGVARTMRGRSRGLAVTPSVETTAGGGKVRGRTTGAGASDGADGGDGMSTRAPSVGNGDGTATRTRRPAAGGDGEARGRSRGTPGTPAAEATSAGGKPRGRSAAPEMQAPDGEAGRRRGAGVGSSGGRSRAAAGALSTGSDDAASTQAASSRRGGTRSRDGEGDLRRELRAFAEQRRDGWNHDDWLGLLNDLRGRGFDVDDEARVGSALERERVTLHLEGVDGMGPRRVQALAERYGTIHQLRGAEIDDLAQVQGMNRSLAQKLTERLRG